MFSSRQRSGIVFTTEMPSAPAASTARATSPTSQLAGESFAYRGSAVAARQAATISAADSGASSTFGQDRFSSIVTSWSRAQVSAYSPAANPPTETHSGIPSSRSRGRVCFRNASLPGLASPMELSIPTSVSAMRTGSFPPRGRGVTVFVTNASSARAVSGAVSASRQPDAFSNMAAPGMAGV
jgi:hypothetical protein